MIFSDILVRVFPGHRICHISRNIFIGGTTACESAETFNQDLIHLYISGKKISLYNEDALTQF